MVFVAGNPKEKIRYMNSYTKVTKGNEHKILAKTSDKYHGINIFHHSSKNI
jgi:hypothetical protein